MIGDQTLYVWGVCDLIPLTNFPDVRAFIESGPQAFESTDEFSVHSDSKPMCHPLRQFRFGELSKEKKLASFENAATKKI